MNWVPPSDQPDQPDRPSDPSREVGGPPPYEGGAQKQPSWGTPPGGQPQQQPGEWGQPPGGQPQQQGGEWGPPPGQQQQQPWAGAQSRRTPGKATASLVLGILGLIICPFVCSVLALVFGYQSRNEIDSDPALGGRGLAVAGIVLGWIGIAFAVLVLIYVVAVGVSISGD